MQEHAVVVIEGLAWVPWLVIFPAVVLLWSPRTRRAGLWTVGAGYVLAAAVGQLQAPAALSLAALVAAGWAVVRGHSRWMRFAGHLLFLVTAVALRLHVAPGFANPLALDGAVSAGAPAFKVYLNLDKTLSAVWVVACIAWIDSGAPTLRRAGVGACIGLATFGVLGVVALGAGVVRPDVKLPAISWLWGLNNLVLVCFAEEVFFRGYVQGGLARFFASRRGGNYAAIAIAAVVFGFSHVGQGLPMQLLSVVAGVGYGIAYQRRGLVGAIAAHALLNVLHFVLLTYPILA